ncbi:hypothetical protein [Sphingomonas citricola]|uniref:hypothetical protein n=1 Tax=Sphingomonas citricola TaxID=2862498 RepID=UPI001CA47413|nr:hypothetical protein [Sphingomonas citricola]
MFHYFFPIGARQMVARRDGANHVILMKAANRWVSRATLNPSMIAVASMLQPIIKTVLSGGSAHRRNLIGTKMSLWIMLAVQEHDPLNRLLDHRQACGAESVFIGASRSSTRSPAWRLRGAAS